MEKVDLSAQAISERLRICGELSDELLRSTFDQRCEVLVLEQAEMRRRSMTEVDEMTPKNL